ncbi:MAG: L,D-transpeptidase family protein, partial [Steroidobacteraceae bacterium]
PWELERWRTSLLSLYESRRFAPLWLDGRHLTRPALALIGELRAAERYGLRSGDYGGNRLLYRAGDVAAAPRTAPGSVELFDLAISICAARFVADLHAGRVNPRNASHFLDVPHAAFDVGLALNALASTTDTAAVLHDYEPGFRHYDLLKSALATYQPLAMDASLTALPPLPHAGVRPGEHYSGAAALARLLEALGDLDTEPGTVTPAHARAAPATAGAARDTLDAALVAALVKFQTRHGLAADGTLGAATFRALTTPLARRVRQIELALERTRWLPPKLDTPPIIVNIPQFELFAFYTVDDDARSMLRMKVIVGRTYSETKTPVFVADMRYLVFRPYWDVPPSILSKELLPKILADPSWVERSGFEIVNGQGDDATRVAATPENVAALARGAWRIRQRPGPDNALGLVKFMLPNRFNVYLHSTPTQSLFARTQRAFSHGCIRVQDPLALAQFVLRDDPAWPRERIEAAMQTAAQRGALPTRVLLGQPIRVYVFYATAVATQDGHMLFFQDLYGHDARLEALLNARRPLLP